MVATRIDVDNWHTVRALVMRVIVANGKPSGGPCNVARFSPRRSAERDRTVRSLGRSSGQGPSYVEKRKPPRRAHLALLGQILATTDHDQQSWRGRPQNLRVTRRAFGPPAPARPSELWISMERAARPRLLLSYSAWCLAHLRSFAESQLRLFGQYFRETMAAPM